MGAWNLEALAQNAIRDAETKHKSVEPIIDANSNNNTANQISIATAKNFLTVTCPNFLESNAAEDEDRLVKIGRSIKSLVNMMSNINQDEEEKNRLISGLNTIIEQCDILSSGNLKVPRVRFGKTEIMMPIVTLGCMRFQNTWGNKVTSITDVPKKQQENLVNILKYSVEILGINHIETANGYGSSEFQLGDAFQQLFAQSSIKREDLIIQTKVNPFEPTKFRKTIEDSLQKLRIDYIDLLSIHGVNMYDDYERIFNNQKGENLIDIAKEYVAKGVVKHIGFSSHGQPGLIRKLIETDGFSYANIHFHAFGSYTASGGETGGNLANCRLLREKDMGTFIISPYDKGGKLYAPSKKLRSLTLPDLEPIQYGSLWLFSLGERDKATPHTITVGAARPSDLDEPAVAAYLYANKKDEMIDKVKKVESRLKKAQIDALGEDWVNTWYKGLPNVEYDGQIQPFGQMVWLYNLIKSYGMLDFATDRYGAFDTNTKGWDHTISNMENIGKKKIGWGYMPGVAFEEGKDYSDFLKNVPEKNKMKVLEAIKYVHTLCSSSVQVKPAAPTACECAYDMRPWTEFPMQK